MITGSVAYGSANDDSDLDLIVIYNENKFVSEYIDEVLVEIQRTFQVLCKLKNLKRSQRSGRYYRVVSASCGTSFLDCHKIYLV